MFHGLQAHTQLQRKQALAALDMLLIGAVFCAPSTACSWIIGVSLILGMTLRHPSGANVTAEILSKTIDRGRF